ncbi:MAG: hypothetical protein ACR2OO_16855 [Thermomicrobiales bacterium]
MLERSAANVGRIRSFVHKMGWYDVGTTEMYGDDVADHLVTAI